jgi:hypothetical protein
MAMTPGVSSPSIMSEANLVPCRLYFMFVSSVLNYDPVCCVQNYDRVCKMLCHELESSVISAKFYVVYDCVLTCAVDRW